MVRSRLYGRLVTQFGDRPHELMCQQNVREFVSGAGVSALAMKQALNGERQSIKLCAPIHAIPSVERHVFVQGTPQGLALLGLESDGLLHTGRILAEHLGLVLADGTERAAEESRKAAED